MAGKRQGNGTENAGCGMVWDPRNEPGGGRIPSKAHATALRPDSGVDEQVCGEAAVKLRCQSGVAPHRKIAANGKRPRAAAVADGLEEGGAKVGR